MLLYNFINKILSERSSTFIHIIGDSILDEDYQVQISRISPECPNVNILLSEVDAPFRCFPGGAANVAFQLNNFPVVPRLFTLIDSQAYSIIRSSGIKYWGHVLLPDNHYIPRKKRSYERNFQVVARRDIERKDYGLDVSNLQKTLVNNWLAFQAEPDVIIFSDYNKGLFSNGLGIKDFPTNAVTIVDPKTVPLERWRNCSIFKPNSKEAEALSGEQDWQKQCNFFRKELNCGAVVITQEGNGVVGLVDDYFEYRPNCNVKPFDIIGAGDCFIAVLALAIANKFTVEEAAKIAFHAGLIYVQQKERTAFGPWAFHSHGKIIKDHKFLKERRFTLAFTNGCFDILHSGHLHTLEYAKSTADCLIVAVNDDESIRRIKGGDRPIIPLEERMKMLAGLQCVDFVVAFSEDTPQQLVEKIQPDVLVKGADWIGKSVAGSDCVKKMCYAPVVEGYSTSQIIEKIKACS